MKKQSGEIIRRKAWQTLDLLHGGKQQKLKEVNKREILDGVTPAYINRRLGAIMDYAAETCPFYRERFQGVLKADDTLRLEDFPVLTKGDFLENYEGILSDVFRDQRDSLHRFSTSGSTGTPFTVLADDDKQMRVNMNFMSVMELNGFRLGMKRGEFRAWIKGKNTISDFRSFTNNLLMIDISNMGDESIRQIYDRIFEERIQVLVAYSSAITALVDYAERSSLDVSGWAVEMIFTMGEALPSSTREKAERIFGITPVLSYGNNENGFIAVSLPGEDVYTIDLYNFFVEILKMDSDEPAAPGEVGRIVVTDYYNKAFPMIRYDTGDTGIMVDRELYEGTIPSSISRKRAIVEKKHPGKERVRKVFTEIWGRRGSLIRNTKGEPLSTHVFMNNLLNFEGEIRQGKCIQTGKKEYLLQLNKEMGAHPDEESIIASYKRYLGDDAEVTIEYVEGLPIQASGKTMVSEQQVPEYL